MTALVTLEDLRNSLRAEIGQVNVPCWNPQQGPHMHEEVMWLGRCPHCKAYTAIDVMSTYGTELSPPYPGRVPPPYCLACRGPLRRG